MIILPEKVFKAYDIRGKDGITPEGFYSFGKALGLWMRANKLERICLGHDTRPNALELNKELSRALVEQGLEVYEVGLCTTPYSVWSMNLLNVQVCAMVTASHNPWEDNGIKLYVNKSARFSKKLKWKKTCYPLCGEELKKLFYLQSQESVSSADGQALAVDVLEGYLDRFASTQADVQGKVIWNANFGGASRILKELAQRLLGLHECVRLYEEGADVVQLLPAGPDPTQVANISFALGLKADCVFSFDGDGDRLQVVYAGQDVHPEQIIQLLAAHNKTRCLKIVLDVHASRTCIENLRSMGASVYVSKVGHSHIQYEMRKHNADIGMEESGHFFFKDCFGVDDAVFCAIKLLEIMKVTGMRKDLFPAQTAFKPKIARIECDSGPELVDQIKAMAVKAGVPMSRRDGVKLFYAEGWILVRSSNTQKCLSVLFESYKEENIELMQDRLNKLLALQ